MWPGLPADAFVLCLLPKPTFFLDFHKCPRYSDVLISIANIQQLWSEIISRMERKMGRIFNLQNKSTTSAHSHKAERAWKRLPGQKKKGVSSEAPRFSHSFLSPKTKRANRILWHTRINILLQITIQLNSLPSSRNFWRGDRTHQQEKHLHSNRKATLALNSPSCILSFASKAPTVGLEPTTTRLRALRSADWARRA